MKRIDWSFTILVLTCLAITAAIAVVLPDAIDQAFQIGRYKP